MVGWYGAMGLAGVDGFVGAGGGVGVCVVIVVGVGIVHEGDTFVGCNGGMGRVGGVAG